MSLIDHTDFDPAKRAALFEERRAAITPTECDLGQLCYVRDGVAAYQRWGSKPGGSCYGYCTGCRGRIRSWEQNKH